MTGEKTNQAGEAGRPSGKPAAQSQATGQPQAAGRPQAAGQSQEPGWANGLKQLYKSVVDEDLPDSFQDLLDKFDDDGKE